MKAELPLWAQAQYRLVPGILNRSGLCIGMGSCWGETGRRERPAVITRAAVQWCTVFLSFILVSAFHVCVATALPEQVEPEGFDPVWSVGDWWVVGITDIWVRLGASSRAPNAEVNLSRPIHRYRYEVFGEVMVDSIPSFAVVIGRILSGRLLRCFGG